MVVGRVIGSVYFQQWLHMLCAFKFSREKCLFSLVLIQMMIPGSIFITPQYLLAQNWVF